MLTPWSVIEQRILEQFLTPGGRVSDRDESVKFANRMLASIPVCGFRGYLSEGLAVVFHEEGPWNRFPEAVHKWGMEV